MQNDITVAVKWPRDVCMQLLAVWPWRILPVQLPPKNSKMQNMQKKQQMRGGVSRWGGVGSGVMGFRSRENPKN